ncbi:MAG TPA: enolase C-terminal domain-like protein [Polyangiaceae bacterium]|jgi:L-alanine-DL-glutamate epimerase-like enolase superfamily enzyme|nr:enolase C-terminal domain-like protein [Polyangiaceae bacterium]
MGALRLERITARAYRIPTDHPESDGTLEWFATVLVVCTAVARGHSGLGYTYADRATAAVIHDTLAPALDGIDARQPRAAHAAMVRAVRNLGRPGIASMAISAVDVALWDLAARLADLPLVTMLGGGRTSIEAYGSGGFTSYSNERLYEQLAGWVAGGMRAVKMKVGRDPAADRQRVALARKAAGGARLFVDANGAHTVRQALAQAEAFAEHDVRWFEEPVSSDDLAGLRAVRERAPTRMDIAAGEYGYDPFYFRRMIDAGAVDVLQADATRCGGVTGFLAVDALCDADGLALSAHCAPHVHAHLACAASRAVHVEYFHDHARIERMLFDGALQPTGGDLRPDTGRPGLGLEFKAADAERYAL